MMEGDLHRAVCTWFQPHKTLPALAFGQVVSRLNENLAAVRRYHLYDVDRGQPWPKPSPSIVVEPCVQGTASHESLLTLLSAALGVASVAADELATDLGLEELDAVYQKWGLRRYRRSWIARAAESGVALGAISAYRGPLGLNFSFLENRAELVLQPVAPHLPEDVAWALLDAARSTYDDFELAAIPTAVWAAAGGGLPHPAATFVREYHRGLWLKEAYPEWYRLTRELHERVRNLNPS
jgi:hypothetical protein